MVNNVQAECSFSTWYPYFSKDSLEAIILPLPDDILKYLEQDAFILPAEATKNIEYNTEWSDGSTMNSDLPEVNNRILKRILYLVLSTISLNFDLS